MGCCRILFGHLQLPVQMVMAISTLASIWLSDVFDATGPVFHNTEGEVD